ncbi:hypothetical protein [Pseudoalteromonas sp. bablab_jr011]|uniref:hypothetical protein n=1 Tax=Pseudoalteromonas sp. bablab_jr011 TaxID=2755062 RepID=UPI0018F2A00F|nr:hypothetical protein [Pseudoalteromonas sp. bablab_jr011]
MKNYSNDFRDLLLSHYFLGDDLLIEHLEYTDSGFPRAWFEALTNGAARFILFKHASDWHCGYKLSEQASMVNDWNSVFGQPRSTGNTYSEFDKEIVLDPKLVSYWQQPFIMIRENGKFMAEIMPGVPMILASVNDIDYGKLRSLVPLPTPAVGSLYGKKYNRPLKRFAKKCEQAGVLKIVIDGAGFVVYGSGEDMRLFLELLLPDGWLESQFEADELASIIDTLTPNVIN